MSKMYFLVDVNGMKSEKAKRINNNVVQKTQDIKNFLMFSLITKLISYKMKIIQSKLHKTRT